MISKTFQKSEQTQIILNILEKLSNQKKVPKKSKWAQIADEIEALNISKETWEHIDACRKEFRADEGVSI